MGLTPACINRGWQPIAGGSQGAPPSACPAVNLTVAYLGVGLSAAKTLDVSSAGRDRPGLRAIWRARELGQLPAVGLRRLRATAVSQSRKTKPARAACRTCTSGVSTSPEGCYQQQQQFPMSPLRNLMAVPSPLPRRHAPTRLQTTNGPYPQPVAGRHAAQRRPSRGWRSWRCSVQSW